VSVYKGESYFLGLEVLRRKSASTCGEEDFCLYLLSFVKIKFSLETFVLCSLEKFTMLSLGIKVLVKDLLLILSVNLIDIFKL